jgi:GNAT superfamily N-acetyltransferase
MRAYAEALWGSWRPSDTVETLDPSGHEIVELDGAPCGCIAVSWHPDHLFIEKLYIGPEHQGRGIGALVLKEKTGMAAERGLPTKLSVLTSNPADRFYKREGFILEAETPERRRFFKPVAC